MQAVSPACELSSAVPMKVTVAHCSSISSCRTSGSGSIPDSDTDEDFTSPRRVAFSADAAPAGSDPGLPEGRLPGPMLEPAEVKPTTRTPLRSQADLYLPATRPPPATLASHLADVCDYPRAECWQACGRAMDKTHGSQQLVMAPACADPLTVMTMSHGEGLTTVMMSHVPSSYTTEKLIALLDSKGYSKQFDFVFAPINFRSGLGVGFAFVNLTTHEQAKQFFLTFNGFDDWESFSKVVCEVKWSDVQGLAENIKLHQNSPIMSGSVPVWYKPILFKGGVRTEFPKPTEKLPRLRFHRSSPFSFKADCVL